jgi:hypothetical protein
MKGMNNICSINQKWVREPSLDPTNGIVTMSEYYTSVRENKIRKENGLPLRMYYSVYNSGKPYPYSIIPKSVK